MLIEVVSLQHIRVSNSNLRREQDSFPKGTECVVSTTIFLEFIMF